MKRNPIVLYVFLFVVFLAGCNGHNDKSTNVESSDKSANVEILEDSAQVEKSGDSTVDGNYSNLTREIIDNNTFINVDISKLSFDITKAHVQGDSITTQDLDNRLAMAKAAIYRFFSNVKIEGDKYVQTVKSGKELNMSEDVYETLLENLEDMNRAIKEAKEKGPIIEMPEVTEEYLNSLLK